MKSKLGRFFHQVARGARSFLLTFIALLLPISTTSNLSMISLGRADYSQGTNTSREDGGLFKFESQFPGYKQSLSDTYTIFLPLIMNGDPLPSAFNKNAPASGTTGASLGPVLSWNVSTNATEYEYCYDTTNDDSCSSWVSTGTNNYVGLWALQPATTYYWQVRSWNGSTGPTYANGSVNAYWSFTTMIMTPGEFNKHAPASSTTGASLGPVLSWNVSTNATKNEYCHDTTNDGACTTWVSTGTNNYVGLWGLQPGTTYYWQVRSWNETYGPTYANSSLSAFWSFSTNWIDISSRQVSLEYYMRVYLASQGVPIEWTGNHSICEAGETSQAFRDAVELRINYFRAMAGVPASVQLFDLYNSKAQQAALMMSVNKQLSHTPTDDWQCFTAEGAEAAGSSNLYLGVYGPAAITGYMYDPGDGNYPVGHRRWILYPQTASMGTGDIPPTSDYMSSNALWVFDENNWNTRPQTREPYVAWPPPGYVPYQVVFPRWSFSYEYVDLSEATVVMTSGGSGIPLTVKPVVYGFGENTMVWEPSLSFGTAPTKDTVYNVTVGNVKISGIPHEFSYQVVVFDPAVQHGFSMREFVEPLGEPPILPEDNSSAPGW